MAVTPKETANEAAGDLVDEDSETEDAGCGMRGRRRGQWIGKAWHYTGQCLLSIGVLAYWKFDAVISPSKQNEYRLHTRKPITISGH
jgi:hypothetical protein